MTEGRSVRIGEASFQAMRPLVTGHSSPITALLIYGSAIKTDDPSGSSP
jgi:hypothetical protein